MEDKLSFFFHWRSFNRNIFCLHRTDFVRILQPQDALALICLCKEEVVQCRPGAPEVQQTRGTGSKPDSNSHVGRVSPNNQHNRWSVEWVGLKLGIININTRFKGHVCSQESGRERKKVGLIVYLYRHEILNVISGWPCFGFVCNFRVPQGCIERVQSAPAWPFLRGVAPRNLVLGRLLLKKDWGAWSQQKRGTTC